MPLLCILLVIQEHFCIPALYRGAHVLRSRYTLITGYDLISLLFAIAVNLKGSCLPYYLHIVGQEQSARRLLGCLNGIATGPEKGYIED